MTRDIFFKNYMHTLSEIISLIHLLLVVMKQTQLNAHVKLLNCAVPSDKTYLTQIKNFKHAFTKLVTLIVPLKNLSFSWYLEAKC